MMMTKVVTVRAMSELVVDIFLVFVFVAGHWDHFQYCSCPAEGLSSRYLNISLTESCSRILSYFRSNCHEWFSVGLWSFSLLGFFWINVLTLLPCRLRARISWLWILRAFWSSSAFSFRRNTEQRRRQRSCFNLPFLLRLELCGILLRFRWTGVGRGYSGVAVGFLSCNWRVTGSSVTLATALLSWTSCSSPVICEKGNGQTTCSYSRHSIIVWTGEVFIGVNDSRVPMLPSDTIFSSNYRGVIILMLLLLVYLVEL